MTTSEAIVAYYQQTAVRARIAEYCGGHESYPTRLSALGLAGFGGRRQLHQQDMAPVPADRPELGGLLDDGADVCRSLGDRSGTLIQLDIDYVSPDDRAEPSRDPAACFERLEPVYRAVRDELARFGVTALVLMTGRGYHFTVRAPLGAPLHSDLISIATLSPALRARYQAEESQVPLALSMGWAHEGAGRLMEYLAHEVLRAVRGRTEVPVTAADLPPPGRGPFICLDLTAYGDPLSSRYARCAFSSHQKAEATASAPEQPFVVALPRGALSLPELLVARSMPGAAARLAEVSNARIPDVDEAPVWVSAYQESALARFHRQFDAAAPAPPLATEMYAKIPPGALPKCVRQAIHRPHPGLLVPMALRAVTLVLWARGWHPRRVADLVRSRYESDQGWGDLWQRYEPAARADFYSRLFAGLVVGGLDHVSDFTCASQQQRGGCPGGECGHELRELFPVPARVRSLGAAS